MTHGRRAAITLAAAAILGAAGVAAQTRGDRPATVQATAGARYQAGWLHRVIWGAHYRELWTTPLQVQVLDLSSFAGGLTATGRGGGRETQSLHFTTSDGRAYAFRSVDKDPTAAMPPDLRETFLKGVIQDQISSSHPVGALVVSPLLEAAGVLHSEPQLFVMPDDPRLGEFRPGFAGMLGELEARPSKDPEDEPEFGAPSKVVNTKKLWEYLDRDPHDRVDARTYLTARLLDIYVGDWDRHAAQWRWARFDDGDMRWWRPIPFDRDQAFSKLDGLMPWLAHHYFPDLVGFGDDYPDMVGLTWDARVLDRRLLVDLERPVWDSVATWIASRLTDSVIDGAVDRLPPEYYARSGAELARALKHRRGVLPQATKQFYTLLARFVDVHATDRAELVEVDRLSGGAVFVRISLRGEASEGKGERAVSFRRTFRPEETREIRLYLHGGDDRVVVRGSGPGRILVRVIAGRDSSEAVDSSSAGVRYYDEHGTSRVVRGRHTQIDRDRDPAPPSTDPAQAPPPDWGSRSIPLARVQYAPDYGAILGVGNTWTHFGFRADPYVSRQTVWLSFATAPQRFRADYQGEFRRIGLGLDAGLTIHASGFEAVRFHGFGNELAAPGTRDYYRVTQADYLLAPSLVVAFSRRASFSFGPALELSQTTPEPGTFLDSLRPYGTGHFGEVSARAEVRVDTRDWARAATSGVAFLLGGAVYPAAWDVTRPFQEAHGEGAVYLTAPIAMKPTLALRAGGKKIWGPYPFHQAAFVGGATTVRGFRDHRFSGDAALFGNAELRLSVFRFSFLAPDQFGVFGLGDVGRVYLSGETSDRWHASVGGGVWVAFLNRANTLSLGYARGAEGGQIYLRAGFLY